MITLKINNKTTRIPTVSELTVTQYIRLKEFEKIDIIAYLSVVLNIDYKAAFNMKLKYADAILKGIGIVEDYTKIPAPKFLVVRNKVYCLGEIGIETVGQRFMIEENAAKMNQEDYLCFVLATAMHGGDDLTEIKKIKAQLKKMPYMQVLPMAFFLLRNLWNGKKSVRLILNSCQRTLSTARSVKRRVVIDLISMVTFWKYKLLVLYYAATTKWS